MNKNVLLSTIASGILAISFTGCGFQLVSTTNYDNSKKTIMSTVNKASDTNMPIQKPTIRNKISIKHHKFDKGMDNFVENEYIEHVTKRGVKQTFIYQKVKDSKGTVILFTGGNGVLNMLNGPRGRGNFLIRSRNYFGNAGYDVVLPYVPSDRSEMFKFRVTKDHINDLKTIINFLRTENNKPIWSVGTSYGAVSALGLAVEENINVILAAPTVYDTFDNPSWTEAFKKRAKQAGDEYDIMTIDKVDATQYRGKIIYLNNLDDTCATSALALDKEEDVKKLFPNSNLVFKHIKGGSIKERKSDLVEENCMGFNTHSFYGIEKEAITTILSEM